MNLSSEQIQRLSEVLDTIEPFDTWRIKVRKLVVDVGAARVTMTRRSKYASLRIAKIEEVPG